MKNFLSLFLAHHSNISPAEKLRSALAAGVAILCLGVLLEHSPLSIYAMQGWIGATVVLLFALPHSPMAQPWNVIVGQIIAGFIGWLISQLLSDMVIAAALAVGLSIWLMHLVDALHPPAAATALTLVLSSSQFHHLGAGWTVVMLAANVGFILLLALLINNFLPHRRYPAPHPPTAPALQTCVVIDAQDIQRAMSEMQTELDVSEDDLLEIYRRAAQHAQAKN
ncbi:MAG: HPP family protein [Gallionella sp.]